MSSWGVQLVVGKLIVDEVFRERFEGHAHELLITLCEQGIELSDCEMAALLEADPHVWATTAGQIDPRLRTPRRVRIVRGSAQNRRCPSTERERQVLQGVFGGRTNKQIGLQIGVSESAVKATLQNLFRKTHVRTRAQLVRVVIDGSLDPLPSAG
jgi:DNA-binding NarL/FixJ family response regulator